MISSNLFNNNSTLGAATGVMNYGANPQAITTNGNYCQIQVGFTGTGSGNAPNTIDSAYYVVQTGAGVTAGTVSVGILLANNTWITATTPNSATGAAFTLIATLGASITYNGSLNVTGSIYGPIHGIRLVVAGLTGGNITYAQLTGTTR